MTPAAEPMPLRRWCLAALALTVAGFVANALLGPLNQDEGWYLYAARRVMAGEMPHRDFFFTQGLVMPAVYAAFGWLWSPFGVLGGRLFTAALGLAALFVADGAVVSCHKRADERWLARLVFWSLLGLSLWFTYFTCIPKAYALCALGLAVALRLLSGLREGGGADPLCVGPGGGLGAHAPPPAPGPRPRRGAARGGGPMLLLLFVPELLLWPEGFREAQAFHAARTPMGPIGVAGCVARVLRLNPLLTLLCLLLGWLSVARRPALKRPPADRAPLPQLWLLCAAALAAVHLLAPVPYDDYLVPAVLPLAMAAALGFTLLPFDSFRLALAKTLTLAALALTCLGSPVAEQWFAMGQDRFWPRVKAEPDLFRLRRAAAVARAAADRLGTDTIWTQETYLAVEAGLKVPRGLEMGPFSKDAHRADRSTPLAAWAGYTFALRFPDLSPAPDRAARLAALRAAYPGTVAIFRDFGQHHTTLTLAERIAP